ncbi:MAG: acylphosphatase [Hyphomicrobiales bacterium]|jgi:acylphosphatase|nr:acylphosphatase [Hyphomicrobiales bacterium]
MIEMLVIHLRISGQVQGVGFRQWTAREARARGLSGFVRNRHDGSVEAVFSGDADSVSALAEACGRGPYGSRVERVDVRQASEDDLALCRDDGFAILPTM